MPQTFKPSSQYSSTNVKDWYLDIWNPVAVEKNDFDQIVVIPPEYDQRPDLMSQAQYGTPNLWWMFAVRNPNTLIDPINDFVAGLEIYIPRKATGS